MWFAVILYAQPPAVLADHGFDEGFDNYLPRNLPHLTATSDYWPRRYSLPNAVVHSLLVLCRSDFANDQLPNDLRNLLMFISATRRKFRTAIQAVTDPMEIAALTTALSRLIGQKGGPERGVNE
jgi:hypothetical protein